MRACARGYVCGMGAASPCSPQCQRSAFLCVGSHLFSHTLEIFGGRNAKLKGINTHSLALNELERFLSWDLRISNVLS